MAAWSRKALKLFDKFLHFYFGKMTPYNKIFKILFQKFSLQHRSTCSIRNAWNLADRNLCNHALLNGEKNEILLSSCRYCVDRAQSCQGQPLTMYSDCSSFHPNWFTFGGVIAECMNTAKVNPIFGWSLSLSRKISCSKHTIKKPCCISVHVSFWFKKIVHFSFTSD